MKKKHTTNADFLEFLNKKYGTKDSDNDGICDEVEAIIGTDPYNYDTDSDGISDGDEIALGLNPLGPGKLKDFFVPHAGNNYQPNSLHPHRLFFYGLSAILIKTLIVIFAVSFPIVAWLSPDVLFEQGRKVIELTNVLRREVGVKALTENESLTSAAYDKAQDMLINQYFAHVGPDNRSVADWLKSVNYNYAVAGENLALGFPDANSVVRAWKKSKTHYANLIDPDFSEIGVGMVAGSYNSSETTLTAQFFGQQSYLVQPALAKVNDVEKVVEKVVEKEEIINKEFVDREKESINKKEHVSDEKKLKTEAELFISLPKINSVNQNVLAVKKKIAPSVVSGHSNTNLEMIQPAGQESTIIRFSTKLQGNIYSAKLQFSNYSIDLDNNNGIWSGSAVILDKEAFKTITLANLEVINNDGSSNIYDIDWNSVVPTKASWSDQYLFLKTNPIKYIKSLFEVSTLFYKLLLTLVVLALLLNVFIERKKQHLKLITSSFGLIILLVFLIIF